MRSPAGEAPAGDDTDPVVEVRILGFPLDLFREARLHNDAVMRELTLIARSGAEDRESVPARLVALSEENQLRYGSFNPGVGDRIEAARARGDEAIDLTFVIPTSAGEAAARLKALLHEADQYCRSGDLISTPPSAECVRFRDWFLDEFSGQVEGSPPTSWPPSA